MAVTVIYLCTQQLRDKPDLLFRYLPTLFFSISVFSRMSSTDGANSSPLPRTESGAHKALEVEYEEMASWYDRFWMDYLNKTLPKPLDMLRKYVAEATTSSILTIVDVGCGTGLFLKRFVDEHSYSSSNSNQQFPKLIGIEPSVGMLEHAKAKFAHEEMPNAEFKPAPAEDLPLADESVDMLCSTNAFHFFCDKEKALCEMKRVLKDGGHVVITDWSYDFILVKLYHWYERLRWFRHGPYPSPLTTKRMFQLVKDAGFDNVSIERYSVRFWIVVFWGMHTVTAMKNAESSSPDV